MAEDITTGVVSPGEEPTASTSGAGVRRESTGPGSTNGDEDGPKKGKRARLACACDRCRKKKVKCDEALPACGPCVAAGVECIVTRPREDSKVAPVRRKTGLGKLDGFDGTPAKRSGNAPLVVYGPNNQPIPPNEIPHSARVSPSLSHLLQEVDQPTQAGPPPRDMPTSYGDHGHTPPVRPPSPHERINDSGILHQDSHRRKFVGASSSQALLKWLDSESTSSNALAPLLRHGVMNEELIWNGLDEYQTFLPDRTTMQGYLDKYFTSMHYLFPLLDEPATRSLLDVPPSALDPVERSLLYSLCAHGADAVGLSGSVTPEGEKYFRLAWRSLPTLISRPFRLSMQVLLLMCLSLRNRNKEGLAWTLASMAIRIGFSYGMHRTSSGPLASLDARIWFTAYCLDKVGSFEAGRVSGVDDRACTVHPSAFEGSPACSFTLPSHPRPIDPFTPYVTLCIHIESIISNLFSRGVSILSAEEALRRIGEQDLGLVKWAETVPIDLRPTSDAPPLGPILPLATPIHLLYHQAMITLHRLSLFDHTRIVLPNISKPSLKQYASRLQNSPSICVTSARATLLCIERISTAFPNDRSWTLHCVFNAIIVLSIHTWRNPSSWQARADLTLLEPATNFAAEVFGRSGFSPEFIQVLPRLFSKTKAKVDRPEQPSRGPTRASSPQLMATGMGGADEPVWDSQAVNDGWHGGAGPDGETDMLGFDLFKSLLGNGWMPSEGEDDLMMIGGLSEGGVTQNVGMDLSFGSFFEH
ncbi:hypothetical protein T439DRAFT_322357 [Meredithblackwellia eburnea MCA 4105]